MVQFADLTKLWQKSFNTIEGLLVDEVVINKILV